MCQIAGTLAENNRLRLANNVVSAFGKLMSAARGEVLCSITTAKVCSYSLAPNTCKSFFCEGFYGFVTFGIPSLNLKNVI